MRPTYVSVANVDGFYADALGYILGAGNVLARRGGAGWGGASDPKQEDEDES